MYIWLLPILLYCLFWWLIVIVREKSSCTALFVIHFIFVVKSVLRLFTIVLWFQETQPQADQLERQHDQNHRYVYYATVVYRLFQMFISFLCAAHDIGCGCYHVNSSDRSDHRTLMLSYNDSFLRNTIYFAYQWGFSVDRKLIVLNIERADETKQETT